MKLMRSWLANWTIGTAYNAFIIENIGILRKCPNYSTTLGQRTMRTYARVKNIGFLPVLVCASYLAFEISLQLYLHFSSLLNKLFIFPIFSQHPFLLQLENSSCCKILDDEKKFTPAAASAAASAAIMDHRSMTTMVCWHGSSKEYFAVKASDYQILFYECNNSKHDMKICWRNLFVIDISSLSLTKCFGNATKQRNILLLLKRTYSGYYGWDSNPNMLTPLSLLIDRSMRNSHVTFRQKVLEVSLIAYIVKHHLFVIVWNTSK